MLYDTDFHAVAANAIETVQTFRFELKFSLLATKGTSLNSFNVIIKKNAKTIVLAFFNKKQGT